MKSLVGLRDDDVVTVLSVREAGADPRDVGDALNVAAVRPGALPSVEVTTGTRAILVESTVPVVVLPVDSADPTATGYG